jgi:hypothetical protein
VLVDRSPFGRLDANHNVIGRLQDDTADDMVSAWVEAKLAAQADDRARPRVFSPFRNRALGARSLL